MGAIRKITPLTYLIMAIMGLYVLQALSNIQDTIQTSELRESAANLERIANRATETAEDTNQIVTSGSRTNLILAELRQFQNESEQTRRALSDALVPALRTQFNQTGEILNVTRDLSNVTDDMQQLVNFLGANFNLSMLERTYVEYNTTQQMNKSINALNEKLDRLLQQQ